MKPLPSDCYRLRAMFQGFRLVLLASFLLAASTVSWADKKPATSQRIGDLVVTFLGLEERESQTRDAGRHILAIQFRAENVGKNALCVHFIPKLETTFGLKYSQYSGNGLRVNEMLPGEKTEGEYSFLVRNGVQPLRIVLKPFSESQTCGGRSDSLSSVWHYREQVEFDLTRPPAAASQEEAAPRAQRVENVPQAAQTAVVLLTGRRGSPPEPNAAKAFHERCPQVRMTTEKGKANYVVELVPSSGMRDNMVVVLNAAGDIIYSGTTFTLGNAAKDACAAILRDFSAKPNADRTP